MSIVRITISLTLLKHRFFLYYHQQAASCFSRCKYVCGELFLPICIDICIMYIYTYIYIHIFTDIFTYIYNIYNIYLSLYIYNKLKQKLAHDTPSTQQGHRHKARAQHKLKAHCQRVSMGQYNNIYFQETKHIQGGGKMILGSQAGGGTALS